MVSSVTEIDSTATKALEFWGTVKLSYEEFQKIPYDGLGHHLVNGVHVITPAPTTRHQRIVGNVYEVISRFVKENNHGIAYIASIDVKFSEEDGYQPDIILLLTESVQKDKNTYIDGAPDLVVEVLSPGSVKSDYGWKKNLAEKHGVKEYWVVDPERKSVDVFSLKDQKYVQATFSGRQQIICGIPALSELRILILDVFSQERTREFVLTNFSGNSANTFPPNYESATFSVCGIADR